MKRIFRNLLILLAVLALCLSAGGCQALDDARATHGTWNADGSIRLNGVNYLLLPDCETLMPKFDYWNTTYAVSVTDAEVPVLLKGFVGSHATLSKDGVFLEVDYDPYEYAYALYCEESRYSEITERIRNGFEATTYCYEYSCWNDEESVYEDRQYILTQAEVDALGDTLATVEPERQSAAFSLNAEYSLYIEACSDDLLFREDYCVFIEANGHYYLVRYSGTDTLVYALPSRHYLTFMGLIRAYTESYDYEYYDDDYSET